MFEAWMMTTNFLICLAAVSSAYIAVNSVLYPKKCQCNCHIPRAILTRSDATIIDSNRTNV